MRGRVSRSGRDRPSAYSSYSPLVHNCVTPLLPTRRPVYREQRIRKRSCNERATSYSFSLSLSFSSKSTGCGAHPNFPGRYCAPRYESARSPRGNRVSRDGLEFFRERERESRVERAYGEYSRGESNRLVCELGGCGLWNATIRKVISYCEIVLKRERGEGSRQAFCSFLLILSATVWIEIGLVYRLGLFNVKKICIKNEIFRLIDWSSVGRKNFAI